MSTKVRDYVVHFKKCKKRRKLAETDKKAHNAAKMKKSELSKTSRAELEEMEDAKIELIAVDLEENGGTQMAYSPGPIEERRSGTSGTSATNHGVSRVPPEYFADTLGVSSGRIDFGLDDSGGKRKATTSTAPSQRRRTEPSSVSAAITTGGTRLQEEPASYHESLPWTGGEGLGLGMNDLSNPATMGELYQNQAECPVKGSIFYSRTMDYTNYNGDQFMTPLFGDNTESIRERFLVNVGGADHFHEGSQFRDDGIV